MSEECFLKTRDNLWNLPQVYSRPVAIKTTFKDNYKCNYMYKYNYKSVYLKG